MFNTPLRYPGGKGRLTQFVADIMGMNGLTGGHYVEPYAGGAGIAISLLYLEFASRVHLNDLNRSVHAFWHSVLNETDGLCRLIKDTPVNMDEWRRQKAIQESCDPSKLDLGFSTFFLNRTNRSGIIKGGVIGGKEQNGVWKIDARYNKQDLIKRIEKIARFRGRISLYNLDANSFIRDALPNIPRQSLVYLDPPYFVKGGGLYEDHYKPEDHKAIARVIADNVQQKWIVSYDDAPEIRQIYQQFRQKVFGLHYSAGVKYKGAEVFIFCDGLIIPDEIAPFRGLAA